MIPIETAIRLSEAQANYLDEPLTKAEARFCKKVEKAIDKQIEIAAYQGRKTTNLEMNASREFHWTKKRSRAIAAREKHLTMCILNKYKEQGYTVKCSSYNIDTYISDNMFFGVTLQIRLDYQSKIEWTKNCSPDPIKDLCKKYDEKE